MKEKLQTFGKNFIRQGYIYTLVCLVLGLVLTIWSEQALFSIVVSLLIFVLLYGIIHIVCYFVSEPKIAKNGRFLLKGLLAIEAVAIFCLAYFLSMKTVIVVFASVMAIMSSVRFQCAIDLQRQKFKPWYMFLIFGSFILIMACLPFIFQLTDSVLFRIVGVTMLFEMIDDFMCRVIVKTSDEDTTIKEDTTISEEDITEKGASTDE
ncbi:hypothetical protein JRC49_09665 [Clostridiales bacterium FE2011]|nr:hypothetical protein JRC49_09665 [Clostridiales bacterium FE2011]